MGFKIAIVGPDRIGFTRKPATDIPCVREFRGGEFALARIA